MNHRQGCAGRDNAYSMMMIMSKNSSSFLTANETEMLGLSATLGMLASTVHLAFAAGEFQSPLRKEPMGSFSYSHLCE